MEIQRKIVRAASRGSTRTDWLDARHSFSFGRYYDPERMGFRSLRVLNDDRIAPGAGFGMHPHNDMEIFTYIVSGQLQHSDGMGNTGVLAQGGVQAMSAGTGVVHSEMNPSEHEPCRLLQIWIVPERRGLEPAYADGHFSIDAKTDKWCLVATQSGAEGSLRLNQDVRICATILSPGSAIGWEPSSAHGTWIQVVEGSLEVQGERLEEGDGVAFESAPPIELISASGAHLLAFDLA